MVPRTLTAVLQGHKFCVDKGITFIDGSHLEQFLSYQELYQYSLHALGALQQQGLKPGNELVMQLDSNRTFLIVFWACILGGFIPVPLAAGYSDEHRKKLLMVWSVLNKPFLTCSDDYRSRLKSYAAEQGVNENFSKIERTVLTDSRIVVSSEEGIVHHAKEEDIAFVQFSSGSTGSPKGVTLSHRNLITNIKAMSAVSKYTTSDSMLSWMPLTHDMGLIGLHLNPLFNVMNHYIMPTSLFIRRPMIWMEKASAHKITVLCSPNFGYEYLLKHCGPVEKINWDLSGVRIIYNGAEPISERLCDKFIDQMARFGLRKTAMCPVYGLAEASLAVTISGLDDDIISVQLDRKSCHVGDRVIPVNHDDGAVSFVCVGKPIDDCFVRVTDHDGEPASAETIGYIQIKGDNVTRAYYNNVAASQEAISEDGWLNTGDLGFLKGNALYITGRAKDIVFSNGQNFYPHDLERIAESVDGIALNKIAIAGFFNPVAQREEIIAFVFHRGNPESFTALASAVGTAINTATGLSLYKILPVKDIPRTTSGKLQRFKLLQAYCDGKFSEVDEALTALALATNASDRASDFEAKLIRIWQQVFDREGITVHDHFFSIGGNSLKAVEMNMRLLQELQMELPPELLYQKQTIRALAKELQLARKYYKPLPRKEQLSHYPLSAAQKSLYYIWEADKGSLAYNIPLAFDLGENVDVVKLRYAISNLIARYDALRIEFQPGTLPTFRVREPESFVLTTLSCTKADLEQVFKSLVKPFDLNHGPLFRFALVQSSAADFLFLDFHHTISDGISIYRFINELMKSYAGEQPGDLPVQFRDYVLWQHDRIRDADVLIQGEQWAEQLSDDLPLLDLPCDYKRPAVFDNRGRKVQIPLPSNISENLKRLALEYKTSVHHILFTVYNILLSKYTNQNDLLVGIPVSLRTHPQLLDMHGLCVNTLPVRTRIDPEATFAGLLAITKSKLQFALSNSEYPFEALVERLQKKRDPGRNALIDTMFIYQNMGSPRVRRRFFDPEIAKFDISLEVIDDEKELQCYLEYAQKLFKAETIARLASHFINLLSQVLSNPGQRIAALKLLSPAEHAKQVCLFNNTTTETTDSKTIHCLFEDQVGKTPDNIAVEYKGEKLRYRDLDAKANHLAALLKQNGITPNSVTAILMNRSPLMIVAILGVLKAGGAYVPIDIDLPEERIQYILRNCRCRVVLSNTRHHQRVVDALHNASLPNTIVTNMDQMDWSTFVRADRDLVTDRDLAYVIYTSGTTGFPKGVMIEHHSLVNYIQWGIRAYVRDLTCGSFPLYTSISFDLTVTSIFIPLLTGNKIVVYEENNTQVLIEKVFNDNAVACIKVTPSHLKLLADSKIRLDIERNTIRTFIVGGEKLETQIAQTISARFGGTVSIYNEYGPTEATVGCMIHKFVGDESSSSVPIGIPINNTQIYVLDANLNPCPVGVTGELYIAGNGLARGYLFNEEMSRQKFIPNPCVDNERLYKTGDMARFLSSETIEYLGRIDKQVKLNGYRIELAEIESHVLQYPCITSSVATVKHHGGNKQLLCVYFRSSETIDASSLRKYLAARLPHYMIPTYLLNVEVIPLTHNGKVDYDALPEPFEHEEKMFRMPANETEMLMTIIWQEVFANDKIGPCDNFFALGGDSIKAVQIASRLMEKGISVSVKEILTYQTIEDLAGSAKLASDETTYAQGMCEGEVRLFPIHSWFLDWQFSNPNYYNQSVRIRFKRSVSVTLLQRTFEKLIQHHDGFRINYDPEKRVLFYNNAHYAAPFSIELLQSGENGSLVKICGNFKAGFDITTSLLIKAALVDKLDDLVITAHHLVMDGISWRILLEDLYTVYHALERCDEAVLPLKTASLKDWSDHLADLTATNFLSEEPGYWAGRRSFPFQIPLDFSTRDWTSKNRRAVSKRLSRELTDTLVRESFQRLKANVPVLLNTALVLALRSWTQFDHFVIEQENHGRHLDSVDVSRTIGWFTALYPVCIEITSDSLTNTLKEVRDQLNNVPGQGLGYGVLKYEPAHQEKQQDLAEIRMNYLGQFERELSNDLFEYCDELHGNESDEKNILTAKLEFNLMIIEGELRVDVAYNQNAHRCSTIEQLVDNFLKFLTTILMDVDVKDEPRLRPADFETVTLDQTELDALFN